MVADEPGFQVATPRLNDKDNLKGKAFYWDPIHPDGVTGARCACVCNLDGGHPSP